MERGGDDIHSEENQGRAKVGARSGLRQVVVSCGELRQSVAGYLGAWALITRG